MRSTVVRMSSALMMAVIAACGATAAVAQGPARAPSPRAASLRAPRGADLAKAGPDSFDVAVHTSKGVFMMRVTRATAPRGADRVWHAVHAHYYDGVRFYRVLQGFMAQFGFNGDPDVTAAWEAHEMPDDPRSGSNARGTVTFATRGPNSRTVQMFINLADNVSLDALGFVPVGRVTDGMAVVDSLYSGYGEGAPRGAGPAQERIASEGNAYLTRAFPKLDRIDSARVVAHWP